MDWEAFTHASAVRWAAFLHEPAGTLIELPLLVARKPAANAYIIAAGASPDNTEALVLWAADRNSLGGAVMTRDAAAWRELSGIGYDDAVKVIARIRMKDSAFEPPLVEVEAILKQGWVRKAR